MLEQDDGGTVYLPTAYTHCQRSKLEALRIDIGTRAVLIFHVDLPRLAIIPGWPATIQLDPRGKDDAFKVTVSRQIYVSALLVVPPLLSSDRRRDG
jgi:hypothetical protein